MYDTTSVAQDSLNLSENTYSKRYGKLWGAFRINTRTASISVCTRIIKFLYQDLSNNIENSQILLWQSKFWRNPCLIYSEGLCVKELRFLEGRRISLNFHFVLVHCFPQVRHGGVFKFCINGSNNLHNQHHPTRGRCDMLAHCSRRKSLEVVIKSMHTPMLVSMSFLFYAVYIRAVLSRN
jgi:hypothetical protein